MKRTLRLVVYFTIASLVAIYSSGANCRAADDVKKDAAKELKLIKPEEAKDYEGQDVAVEFDVVSSRELGTGICFLNSISDFSDPTGFTAVISNAGLAKFKTDPKTEKPAAYFKMKRVRVSGKVIVYQKDKDSPKKYEIKVDDPGQIKVIEETAPEAEKK